MKLIKYVAAIALGLCTITSYADSTNTIPNVLPGLGISIAGLALQPGANNLVYAVHTKPLPVPDPNWTQESVSPGFHPAFTLGFIYTNANRQDQLKLNWLFLSTSDNASNAASGSDSVAPPYAFGPLEQRLRGSYAKSKAQFDVSAINLIYDHIFDLGSSFRLTPFVGADTAYLKQNITSQFTGTSNAAPYSITSYNESRYIGAGPRFGLDFEYFFSHGLGIISEAAASILVGSMQSNTHFLSFGDTNQTPGYTGLANDYTQVRVVPGLDAKLGMTYTKSYAKSMMILEWGYLFSTYLDGINQVVPTALVPAAFNNGVIAVETDAQVQSNLDLSGPYLKLTYMF